MAKTPGIDRRDLVVGAVALGAAGPPLPRVLAGDAARPDARPGARAHRRVTPRAPDVNGRAGPRPAAATRSSQNGYDRCGSQRSSDQPARLLSSAPVQLV